MNVSVVKEQLSRSLVALETEIRIYHILFSRDALNSRAEKGMKSYNRIVV